MVTERIEVRLDPERKRKLADMALKRGVSASRLVRQAIDLLYEVELRSARLAAVERISRMNIEHMPEPEELSRQLDATYDSRLP